MITWQRPELLAALLLPWALIFWRFARVQRRGVKWIEERVAPRFRGRLTAYTGRSLGRHLVLLFALGLALILAAAGPGRPGEGEVTAAGGRVLLLLDGSASMNATDPQPAGLLDEPATRFALAQGLARALVERLPGYRFALATFSGVASLQLPATEDRQLVLQALEVAEIHAFYRHTGSSFAEALDAALHFVDERRPDLQVVLFSDGEQPFPEGYAEPLAALAHREVPVHAVALGSVEGETRLIYDFRDVVAGNEEPRTLAEFTTRRVDEHLERIADATGGVFAVAGPDAVARLERAIRRRQAGKARVADERARRDLSALPLGLFLALFLIESALLGRGRRAWGAGFELERLGAGRRGGAAPPPRAPRLAGLAGLGLAGLGLAGLGLAAGCGDSPIERAHRENELGIARDLAGQRAAARTHYERSAAYRVRPEIPTYNLARSVTEAGDYSEAHDLYQQALERTPGLVEAHYNDGVALYRWGDAERDPRGCQLERTLELWLAAESRFATAVELTPIERIPIERTPVERAPGDPQVGGGSPLGAWARANHHAVSESIGWARRLIADPPPECFQEQPTGGEEPQAGGAASGEGEGTGGGEREEAGGGGEEEPEGGGGEGGEEDGGEEEQEGRGAGEGGGAGEGEEEREGRGAGGEGEEAGGGGRRPGGGGGGGSEPLNEEEIESVRQAYERLEEQLGEEGKFFRRTLPEQFPREVWENPEAEIWW